MSSQQDQRICILGNSGSGKSTLAHALSTELSIPAYHLDRELLMGQFQWRPEKEQAAAHTQFVQEKSWIIDGNYGQFLPERLQRATLVIFLDVGRPLSISRALQRFLKNSHLRSSIPSEARNQLSWRFLKWVFLYSRRKRLSSLRELTTSLNHVDLLILKPAPLELWVNQVKNYLTKKQAP